MNRTILITGSISALVAVLLGAFGAHGLEKLIDPDGIDSFTTGVRYQMYHSLVLLFLGNGISIKDIAKKRLYYFFLIGIILFSGSIYLLVIDEIIGISFASLGFITPLGGLCLITGWVFLIIALIKSK